jgi:hypothetical protein
MFGTQAVAAYGLMVRNDRVRLMVQAGEVVRLADERLMLRVISGKAWVTRGTGDLILSAGEKAELPPPRIFRRRPALLSALGRIEAVVEISRG